jgi:FkbM family methyltransferase
MIDFGSLQGRWGRFLRKVAKLFPKNIVFFILQGPARGMLWKRASGVDGYLLGSYEKKKQRVFSSLIREGAVVYDIGANVGFYSLVAAASAKNVRVFAFEPEDRNFAFLLYHIRKNAVSVTPFQVALSDKDGTESFALGPNSSTHQFSAEGTLTVPARTIDSLISDGTLPPPNVMKIDVEGAELKVLRGGIEMLRRHHPALVVETDNPECFNLLRSEGYELTLLSQGEYLAKPAI